MPATLNKEKKNPKKSHIEYCLIPIRNFKQYTDKELDTLSKKFTSVKDVVTELENDCYYNYQLKHDVPYKIFGDIDYLPNEIKVWSMLKKIIRIMNKIIDGDIEKSDVSLTKNDDYIDGMASYHYVIKKYNATVKSQKKLFEKIIKELPKKYTTNDDHEIIDTSNYCKHKLRLPNQSKGESKQTHKSGIHRLKNGTLNDFILDYIPKDSINIDDKFITTLPKKEKKIERPISIVSDYEKQPQIKELFLKNIEWELLIHFMDDCYKPERYSTYNDWINIGMAIKNRYGVIGYELFEYFSMKSENHDTSEKLRKTYDELKTVEDGLNIGTLYYYAKQDNKEMYGELVKKYSPFKEFAMTSADVASYIKLLKPNSFVWRHKKLYCYNGKYWENDDLIMRQYITTELYEFMKDILVTCFWNVRTNEFDKMKKSLNMLKKLTFKKEVIETTMEYLTNNNINFDEKWYLVGFTNVVYDLRIGKFREYKYDDFISITTGYDWREPTGKEYESVKYLFNSIMPIEDECQLLKEIMSTGLEGRCLEKFNVFNGGGRNGKGLINDLWLRALGNYGLIANNAILFEKNKTGSNPEKNNINKKRYVVFREPPQTSRFENSIVKELTGGGGFSARGHHESDTEKLLYLTMVVECNKRPLFSEEPQKAELERLIDVYFRSTFVESDDDIDKEKYMFKANKEFKTEEFKEQHKYAIMKIMMETHETYMKRNYVFQLPKFIQNRTKEYLEMSCKIMGWFNENYEKTDNKNDFVKLQEVFGNFQSSEYYFNMSKYDKRQYNYRYFIQQIEENIFFARYYVNRIQIGDDNYRNILMYHKKVCNSDIN